MHFPVSFFLSFILVLYYGTCDPDPDSSISTTDEIKPLEHAEGEADWVSGTNDEGLFTLDEAAIDEPTESLLLGETERDPPVNEDFPVIDLNSYDSSTDNISSNEQTNENTELITEEEEKNPVITSDVSELIQEDVLLDTSIPATDSIFSSPDDSSISLVELGETPDATDVLDSNIPAVAEPFELSLVELPELFENTELIMAEVPENTEALVDLNTENTESSIFESELQDIEKNEERLETPSTEDIKPNEERRIEGESEDITGPLIENPDRNDEEQLPPTITPESATDIKDPSNLETVPLSVLSLEENFETARNENVLDPVPINQHETPDSLSFIEVEATNSNDNSMVESQETTEGITSTLLSSDSEKSDVSPQWSSDTKNEARSSNDQLNSTITGFILPEDNTASDSGYVASGAIMVNQVLLIVSTLPIIHLFGEL